MAIYRTLYYTDVSIGVGGRITIPQGLRDDLRLAAKDSLTVRVEETSDGRRQMVILAFGRARRSMIMAPRRPELPRGSQPDPPPPYRSSVSTLQTLKRHRGATRVVARAPFRTT